MFSKYSSIEVPQNYSGSRFRKSQEIKTETKTHPATDYSATKSSVSPTYKDRTESCTEAQNDYCESPSPCDDCTESYSCCDCESDCIDSEDTSYSCEDENKSCERKDDTKQGFLLGDMLANINKEDLLLICLIIFLSADGGISNNDIIILLSLILAYHA